jgi:predicted nucleic acid-binding protein
MRALIDTSALLALSHGRDQYHETAVAIAKTHRSAGGRFVGTTSILTEFHSHLLYLRDSAVARAALMSLLADPIHEWLEVDAELLREANGNWLLPYEDQRFSLVDAVSFEVMRRTRVARAFAFDRHFEVAGFELLSPT